MSENSKKQIKLSSSLLLPPPNITGSLHLGHAFETVIQDYIFRSLKLFEEKEVNWLVGLDHAGIATQRLIENEFFQKKKLSLVEKKSFVFQEWYPRIKTNFCQQWASLDLSIDPRKLAFTFDEQAEKQVASAFIELFKAGFIFLDQMLVNWDPEVKSVISDIETKLVPLISELYYLKYFLWEAGEKKEEYLIVATSRPETIFADVALFVNPNDQRYQNFVGKTVVNPAGRIVPVLVDSEVKIDFGSGVLKCTPGHDKVDYFLAKKHSLEIFSCCDQKGVLNSLARQFKGRAIHKVRADLKQQLLNSELCVKIEKYESSALCSLQTGVLVETFLAKQWFLDLPKLILFLEKTVPNFIQQISFFPLDYQEKIFQWKKKTEVWCLSRQLWWGHKIPAYFNKKTAKLFVGTPFCVCRQSCPSERCFWENWEQESGVLDTWFSSALWPLLVSSKSFSFPSPTVYPISYLITGYDILFFWVWKMILLATYFENRPPFKKIFFHGLIRDCKGKKMSKSFGNGVEPGEIIAKYGSDSLRLFFSLNSKWGADLFFSEKKVVGCWRFCQKLNSIFNFVKKNVLPADLKKIKINDFK